MSHTKQPRLSVAIVTRNRAESLERTLKSIRAQSHQPWEILVSDDSFEDQKHETKSVADAFDCRYQHGPGTGLYTNRNASMAACHGDFIRTMDDDHEFPESHFEICLDAIKRDPTSIWIIGETTNPAGEPKGYRARCPGQLHPRGFSVQPADPQNCRAISCGGTIYPRSVADRGFRNVEDFRFGKAYLEFGCRLSAAGFRIRHLSETYLIHHLEEMGRSHPHDDEYEAARLFAMFSLSRRYRPTIKNQLLTIAEIGKQFVKRGLRERASLQLASEAWRRHRDAGTGPFATL